MIPTLLTDYTFRTILLGSTILGLFCAILGSFAVLRKQSLVGDALAHAALPGIATAYLLTGSKSTPVLLVGAAISCGIAMAFVHWTTSQTQSDSNTTLGIALTSFFGLGILLLGIVQNRPDAGQAGLEKFLFGQAAALTQETVLIIAILGLLATGVLFTIQQPYKLLAFDPSFAQANKAPIALVESLQTGLLVIGIVIGLNTVGVVLLSALLVAPTIAARPWAKSTQQLLLLASIFGLLASALGSGIAVNTKSLPTGPTVVVTLVLLTTISHITSQLIRQQRRKTVQP